MCFQLLLCLNGLPWRSTGHLTLDLPTGGEADILDDDVGGRGDIINIDAGEEEDGY